MEPITPLDKEFFKRKNLVDLARMIVWNHACDWQVLPFAQKYYGLARQIFIKRICAAGHSPCLAFEYVMKIKKFYKSNQEDILEDIIDLLLMTMNNFF